MNYEIEVKKVYPDAYMAYNNLFETYKVYENHRCEKRIGDASKNAYAAWEYAYNAIKYQKNQTK